MSMNLEIDRSERALCARPQASYRKPSARSARRSGRSGRARGLLAACALAAVPLSSSCNIYSVKQDNELGTAAFQQVLAEEKILTSGPAVTQVKRVTDRLVLAAKEIDPEIANEFEWEVTVIDDDAMVNAFCLPGGKMAVYTGILPVTQTDGGLAVVMGHEIAHATYRHGTERLSRNMPLDIAIGVLAQNQDQAAAASILANLGWGLPWSRSAELEADRVGLMYMAKAGYDPREAPEFWGRMAELSGGGGEGLAEYFSTHPATPTRIEEIRKHLPAAMALYEQQKKSLAP